MIPDAIQREVQARLQQIEAEEAVTIVYACESGSRAWGFASADSDYDVRFLYVHPRAWYLSIDLEHRRDVIERPVTDLLDFSGWDLRKALQLLRKSNPPLLEWLSSPIVYRSVPGVVGPLRGLLPVCYAPAAAWYHYLHMAQGNYRNYLRGEEVWLKKYFYVLRPLLALLWIEQDLGAVPMAFQVMSDRLITDPALKADLDALLHAKRAGDELDRGPAIPSLGAFIDTELTRLTNMKLERRPPKPPVAPLNTFFRWTLDYLENHPS
jgi:predicted nucleotidyltransferase